MKLSRTFNTVPPVRVELDESENIVLLYYSLKNTAKRWASFVGSYVKRPSKEVQDRLDVLELFYNMDNETALKVAAGCIPELNELKNQ